MPAESTNSDVPSKSEPEDPGPEPLGRDASREPHSNAIEADVCAQSVLLSLPGGWKADVSIRIDDKRWNAAIADVDDFSIDAIRSALEEGDAGGFLPEGIEAFELSLLLTDDRQVQSLNRDFRGKDQATNVLSFAFFDDETHPDIPGQPAQLGDIVIAFETTAREADERGIPLKDHLFHLCIHGVLHLLGYDHQDDDEAKEMEDLETAILAARGIKDPHLLTDGEA